MRLIQVFAHKLLAAAAITAGVYVIAQELGYWAERVPLRVPQNSFAAWAVGVALMIVGLLALLPILRFRRKAATIAFPGEHGDVLIHLDSVQANLNKVVSKRPEVRKSYIKVIPVADKRRVRLEADVLLIKTPGAGARELAEKLRKFIATTAANMLGIDEIATVDLNVRGIVVDKGVVKAMAQEEPAFSTAKISQEERPAVDRVEEPVEPVPSAEPLPRTEPAYVAASAEPVNATTEPYETDERPADDEPLRPLPSWETEEPVPADQADIVTPVADEIEQPASRPSDEEPRDKTLFP